MAPEGYLGCAYGTHRVVEPKGVLPQAAWKVDNSPDILDNEILIDVATLNVDAASFKQIVSSAPLAVTGFDLEKHVESQVMDIVKERGKMHNPVTGSGGMLLGTVRKMGSRLAGKFGAKEGDRIATLVSLSLTPLKIQAVKKVHLDKDQIDIQGTAVLFESGVFAVIPTDIDERLALAVLDVAGAPIQTARLVKPGDSVLILGAGGKSGLMCTAVAKNIVGTTGKVIALAHSPGSVKRCEELGMADAIIAADAKNALEVMSKVMENNRGEKVDVAINCVNIPGTEMGSILPVRDGGKVYFFSMATSFTAAALGAEGVGADVELIIGNGYARGHAQYALDLVQNNLVLRRILERMFLS